MTVIWLVAAVNSVSSAVHLFSSTDEVLKHSLWVFLIQSFPSASVCGFIARYSGISMQLEMKLFQHVYQDCGASRDMQMDNNIIGDSSHLLLPSGRM